MGVVRVHETVAEERRIDREPEQPALAGVASAHGDVDRGGEPAGGATDPDSAVLFEHHDPAVGKPLDCCRT